MPSAPAPRTRGDLCPGVLRPWPADDGSLVRLRLVGGHLTGPQLNALLDVAERFGDGAVHLTSRANLQVRGLDSDPLPEHIVVAFELTGLLPSRSHELVRNILVSPQSGFSGGRADLREIAGDLDRLLLADPALAALPGRFLFVLDDGRGDLIGRPCDLGVVALDAERGQLRLGDEWGAVVPLDAVAAALTDLAREFLSRRGERVDAPWHVREVGSRLAPVLVPHGDLPGSADPLPYGGVAGGHHHEIPDGVLTRASAAVLLDEPILVVTPWRGVFVPDSPEQR